MTTTVNDNDDVGTVRRVPLSRIEPADGFNPRTARDPERFARLVASVRADGLLSPLLVTPTEAGFRLVAGEGRWLACGEAGVSEVPVHVVAVDDKTGGLELAMAENLARQDLDPVEEAYGFQRLHDAGLTKKGIAERLGLSQKRITDRLEILKLPSGLHPQIATGHVPPAAIRPLVKLHAIHEQLPAVAVARVAAGPAQSWMEPVTWADVIDDPIAVLLADASGDGTELPAGVFEAGADYPVDRFALDQATQARAMEVAEMAGVDPASVTVRFGRAAVEQATALKAAHASKGGYGTLIVGQDVADQLATEQIARLLDQVRDRAARDAQAANGRRQSATDDAEASDEPLSEEEVKAQRQAEREAEQEVRRVAHAHNLDLGAAVLKHLARVKVDTDVLRVLTAVDVVGDLGSLAMRGARYGLPGWTSETAQKNGKVRVEYLDKAAAGAKAREFLDGARSVGEIAGRLLCLVVMARYADEDAVARSQRSFVGLKVGDGAPWAGEVLDLIDGLCVERLPEHLTTRVREARAEQRAAAQARAVEVAAARERLDGLEDRVVDLDDEQRQQAVADIDLVHGFSIESHRLKSLLRDAAQPAFDAATESAYDEPAQAA